MEIYDESVLTPSEIERQNNIINNYAFMKACGLPVKPLIYVKQNKVKLEKVHNYNSGSDTSESSLEDGDWKSSKAKHKKLNCRVADIHQCKKCGVCFTAEIYLISHIRRCKIKNKSFEINKLKNGADIKITEENIKISGENKENLLCRSNSKTKINNNLTTHIKLFPYGKPYECTYCDYECAHKSTLTTLVKIQTGEKPFKCTYCNYECIRKDVLTEHVKIHTGEKPFKCTYCDYECARKTNLTRHVKIHTGEKPFKCTYCDYECTQKGTLTAHVKIHTGEKLFKCTYCDYECTQKVL
uniref:Transcription factor ZNF69 n=1 Tax=Hydra vulgaris TaxID=6087 RepID=I3V7X1_HYDVU|nr:transcription factor ZNF69 [Hydra vulgaris]